MLFGNKTKIIQKPTIKEILFFNKITFVDDDLELAKTYRKELESDGFITNVIFRREEVVEHTIKNKINLLFIDLMKPDFHGFEILKNLKRELQTRDVPAIILTTLGEINHIQRALQLGAADYILKSAITPQKLKDIARKYLVSHRARFNL